LTAAAYFDAGTDDEQEIRTLADALYRRANWLWAQNKGVTLTHAGIRERVPPLPVEAMMRAASLHARARLADLSADRDGFPAWCSTYQWKTSTATPIFTRIFLHASALAHMD